MLNINDLRAGKAIFTVSNDKGEHYTFKIAKHKQKELYFISLLTGSDNTKSYTYLGILSNDNLARLTAKSSYNRNSKPFRVFNWAVSILKGSRKMPTGYDIKHAGNCLACGRLLTTPESIASGYGPICISKSIRV